MEKQKPLGTYIYVRIDKRSGKLYLQGRDWKLHLAGKVDPEKDWDKFLFTAAKNVLGEQQGLQFKKDFISILRYMAELNQIGEVTKVFSPMLVMYGPEHKEVD